MYSEAHAEATSVVGNSEEDRRRAMGAAIKHARDARRLSQAKLAQRVNVDVSTIGRIESGKLVPNLVLIWALADALEVPIASLVAAELGPKATLNELGIGDLANGLPPVTQAQLQSFQAELDSRFEKIEIALGIRPPDAGGEN